MAREVIIETRDVGQHFGHAGVVRDARTGATLAETEDIRPWGFQANAARDAERLAEARGWVVREDDDAP